MEFISKRKVSLIIISIILLVNIFVLSFVNQEFTNEFELCFDLKSGSAESIQLNYSEDELVRNEKVITLKYSNPNIWQTINVKIPDYTQYINITTQDTANEFEIKNISVKYIWEEINVNNELISTSKDKSTVILQVGQINFQDKIVQIYNIANVAYKIFYCIVIDLILIVFMKYSKKFLVLPFEIINNRKLIFNLAINDFKTKYAGSYLGIIWAFIQPVITVLIYWFVFQVGFKSAPIKDFPFVLWLIAGIVPWFFFNESLLNATNSLLEYSYLVKKVVFKVSILPLVKIVSALFVHLFFIIFTIVIYSLNGYTPTVFLLQVIYYSFCIFMLSLSLSFATSAIVLFFKDLGQIVNILLQIGMWLTPIMWSNTMIPEKYQWILKLNPMYYVSEGYRDAFINHIWFFEKFNQTIYFWIATMFLLLVGILIFKRLKPHFADVL
jgi:teichoic acid transport system permease protein